MKILTVCQRGNVRSATVATILKDYGGYLDVIAIGVHTSTPETIAHMAAWSDLILISGQRDLCEAFKDTSKPIIYLGIEIDQWGEHMHPNLVDIALEKLQEHTKLITDIQSPNFANLPTYIAANRAAHPR